MQVEPTTNIRAFTITGARGIDPIIVILQDIAPSRGRIIVECSGEAWSAYFGNMFGKHANGRGIADFLASADADRLGGRLARLPEEDARATKFAAVVIEALRAPQEQEGPKA